MHPVKEIVVRHKKGEPVGMYSVCSAHPFVIEAAVRRAVRDQSFLLVEATSNQVDQFGGYTGMRPADFARMVRGLAQRGGLPDERLILGGDHLGPNVWRHLEAETALENAKEQIAAYVRAGFSKIHLDASMPLKGDRANGSRPLDAETVARRSALLCQAAEEAARELPDGHPKPVYVIGTDVPVPGGATDALETLRITPVDEVRETIRATKQAFFRHNLQEAWQRVVAVVVQPGVEFGEETVIDYQPEKAGALSAFIETQKNLIYEAHSTDYQSRHNLRRMVEDHFAVLKVGPALTFALREALFALSFIEDELAALHPGQTPSNLRRVLDEAMTANPTHWQRHHRGTAARIALARRYAFSDRIRYYWPQENVRRAVNRLFENLREWQIPVTLISQYLPEGYRAVRHNAIENTPDALAFCKIDRVLSDYAFATGMTAVDPTKIVATTMETV